MSTSKNYLNCLLGYLWLAIAASNGAAAAEPAKIDLQLPLNGKEFTTYSIEFSATNESACIAGTDYDEMGTSTGRLLLANLAGNSVRWQKSIAVPDGLAQLIPVQCLVGTDRVYLLANVDTSSSPPQARTSTYVMAFDMHGKQIASTRMQEAQNQYGYVMGLNSDGLTVVGYTRSNEGNGEHYGTFTSTFDAALRRRGTAVTRNTGAYTGPIGVRLVGANVYLIGRFFGANVTRDDLGKFAASRLVAAGGYSWSTPIDLSDNMRFKFSIMDDGTGYAIGYSSAKTTVARVTPQGKSLSAMTYPSRYCRTNTLASHGDGLLAVRRPCSGKTNGLVFVDFKAGQERLITAVPDNPVYVASHGTAWAVMASDKKGKLFLYSEMAGEL